MKIKSYFLHSIILASTGLAATTQSSVMTEKDETLILKMFPNKNYSVWVSTMGDINGDKIEDVVAILTTPSEVDQREEMLIVLTGSINHSYKLLSATNEFCQANNFPILQIENNSLLVETVASASSSHIASMTMKFKYNKKYMTLNSLAAHLLARTSMKKSIQSARIHYMLITSA